MKSGRFSWRMQKFHLFNRDATTGLGQLVISQDKYIY